MFAIYVLDGGSWRRYNSRVYPCWTTAKNAARELRLHDKFDDVDLRRP